MRSWIIDAAEAVREAAGIGEEETPTVERLERLFDGQTFGRLMQLEYGPVSEGVCIWINGGKAIIILPPWLRGEEHTLQLAHEIGHAVCGNPLAGYHRRFSGQYPHLERLTRLNFEKEERVVRDFVQCLYREYREPALWNEVRDRERSLELAGSIRAGPGELIRR